METIKIIAELELCSQDDVYCGKNTFENKKLTLQQQKIAAERDRSNKQLQVARINNSKPKPKTSK